MSEIVLKSCSDQLNSDENEDYISLCCSECSDLLLKIQISQLKHYSSYFRDVFDHYPMSSDKEVIIFLNDVPCNDLKTIVSYISGEDIRVLISDLSSLEKTCARLQIVELLALIRIERSRLFNEMEIMSEVSDISVSEKRVVSELIPSIDTSKEKCVFEKIWFKDGDEDLDNENDDSDFSVHVKTAEQHEHSSSGSSSVYFDCNESSDKQMSSRRKLADNGIDVSDILVEDAVIEVETSSNSSNSVDSSNIDYASVTTAKLTPNETENPLDNSFSSVASNEYRSRRESSKDMLQSPSHGSQTLSYIYLPPFASLEPSGLRYSNDTSPEVLPPPPPLTPFYSIIGAGNDVIKEPQAIDTKSTCSASPAVVDNKCGKGSKRKIMRFKCGLCGREMGWRQSLRVHIFQQHPGNEPNLFIQKINSDTS